MALPLRLIVGLGNPGRPYALTRHNAGAWFVERLVAALGLSFQSETRFHSLIARDRASDGGDLRFVLPKSYMNESGFPVAALAHFYRVSPLEILIAHDELDMKPGSVKLKLGGGSAGNSGGCGSASDIRATSNSRSRRSSITCCILRAPKSGC